MAFPVLYPIVDPAVCAAHGVEPLDLAGHCLRGGARLLQLRVKTGGSAAFLDLARRMRELADSFGARLVVNDRADIAAMAGAAGVHVGQDDLPVAVVRGILRDAGALVGVSTHTPQQVDAAVGDAPGYIAVGPIFGTATKDTGYPARGLDLIRYAAAATAIPVVAIGGLTLDNAASAREAGASSIAVISDLFAGGDPEARVRAYLARL
jgi:thiamine-phosphate pyrophosphorylase